jgi:outer membrane receptor for ferric coprogen and ferric-rhodotorulic acid
MTVTGFRKREAMKAEGSRLALLILATATLLPGEAMAEGAEDATRRDDIVVTGKPTDYGVTDQASSSRLNLSLRDTPQAISVVTRAQIEDFNLNTVDQLLIRTTGVNVERSETDRTYYNARGFDIVNFQFDGIGQPLSYGLQTGQIETSLFERVEIVRGATGLLSQTGNPSAAVNFVRKRPTREFKGNATVSYASYDQFRGNVDVNVPLTENGNVRSRFVATYEGGDSYLDYYKTSRWTVYGVVAADLTPDTVLTAGYSWQASDPKGVTWGGLPFSYADGSPATYARSATTAQPWTRWNTADRNLFADLTHNFGGGWEAKLSVLHRSRDQDSLLFYVYGSQDQTTGDGLYSWPGAYHDRLRETTVDAHVSGPFNLAGRQHELVFGVNYGKSLLTETAAADTSQIGIALPGNSAFNGSFPYPNFGAYAVQADFNTEISSAYGLARLSLAEPIKLMLGANVTHAKRTGISYGTDYIFDRTKFLPFAGVTLDLSRNISAYASYATIFNPQIEGGVNNSILPPIEGETYEAGLKGEWNNGRLTGAIAVFKTKQKNVAESLGFIDGRVLYRGVDASSRGVEVDIAGELLPGLQLTGGYAYVHIEDNDGADARTFIPRHTVRVNAVYSPPALKALRFGASTRFQSRTYNTYTAQKGYAVADLMARYQVTRNASVGVNMDNVTNVKYWNSLQWGQAYYGAPRTGRVTLGLNF